MKFLLQQNVWQGFEPVEITLPDDWDVQYCQIKADEAPELTRVQLTERINKPYGIAPLYELAKTAREAVIVFDDISRATPTRILAEIVLEQLLSAGMEKKRIRFICALGTHGAHNRVDFVQKLGEDILHNYRVYNHNCYDNNVCIGYSKRGFPVCVNQELMSCDLKIGLGAILPHTLNSFGGGSKLIFPGVASIDTIVNNHEAMNEYVRSNGLRGTNIMGDLSHDLMRSEIEEMASMVGPFFKIDCIYNTRFEIVDCYAGDPIKEYYAAIPAAQELLASDQPHDCDVVIANANARANEASLVMSLSASALKNDGGDVVIVDHTSRGQVVHYVYGKFGENSYGRLASALNRGLDKIKRVICYMPYPDLANDYCFDNPSKQIYCDDWGDVLCQLKDYGAGTKAAVLVDGTMMYFRKN